MAHRPDKNGLAHPLSANLSDREVTWTDFTDHEARAKYLAGPKPEPHPLTPEEVAELDSYGVLRGYMMLPERCVELWTREMMWGAIGAKQDDTVHFTKIIPDGPYSLPGDPGYGVWPIKMVGRDEL